MIAAVAICVTCGSESEVKDSRGRDLPVRRRRHRCKSCGLRWTTFESRYEPSSEDLSEGIASRLPKRLRIARIMSGATQADVADVLGKSKSYVQQVEQRKLTAMPQVMRVYQRLARGGAL